MLEPVPFGRLTLVLATVALFQLLLDLTSGEAVVKYGFRYIEQEAWGAFAGCSSSRSASRRRVRSSPASVVAVAPFDEDIYGVELTKPLLIASVLPLLYSIEGTAASVLVLRSRYDVRAALLGWTMALRLIAIVIGAPRGGNATVVALVLAQVIATATVGAVGLAAAVRFPVLRARRCSRIAGRSSASCSRRASARASSRSAPGSRPSCSASSATFGRSASSGRPRRRSRVSAR